MDKKYVYLLSLAHLSNDITSGALPAILPFFVSTYGMGYSAVAGLMFASCFLSSVIQPLFGWLADKKSQFIFIPLGIFVSGVAMGAAGLFSDYWLIFAMITLSGVGGAIFHPQAARLVNRVSGSRRGLALGIFSVGGNSGFAIGPVLVVAAIAAWGLKGTTVLCAIGIAMSAVLMVMSAKLTDTTVEEHGSVKRQLLPTGENDWQAFLRLTLLIVCSSIVICGLRSFIPLYWVGILGLPETTAGSALTLLFALGVVTTLLGGFMADHFGYLKIVRMSYVLLAPLVILLSQTKDVFIAYLLIVPMGFAMFSPYSAVIVLGQSYLARSIGFASGVTMGLSFSVGGVVVPLIGRFADACGLVAAMELLAAVAVLAAVFTFFLKRPVSRRTLPTKHCQATTAK